MDGAFKTFHTYGIFRYVNEIAYTEESNFQRYLGALAERLREEGFDVDPKRIIGICVGTTHAIINCCGGCRLSCFSSH